MANLFTRDEFATWCQTTIATDDAFATAVMDNATALVVDAAAAPGWELVPSSAPRIAKLIALRVARRTYLNPDQELSSSVGPLSASVLKDAAAGMTLTEAELEQLLAVAPGGNPADGVLWVQRVTGGPLLDPGIVELPSAWGPIPYAYEGETSAFDAPLDDGDTPGDTGGGIDPDAFLALQAQVSTLMGSVSTLDTEKADQDAVDAALAGKADAATVGALEDTLATKADTTALTAGLATKASTAALAGKADTTALTAGLATKADQTAVDAALDLKQDAADAVTPADLADKAEQSDLVAGLATKASAADLAALDTRVDATETGLATKADQGTIDDLFDDVNATLATKADTADLGPQIHVGTDAPTSGSGELWADTDG